MNAQVQVTIFMLFICFAILAATFATWTVQDWKRERKRRRRTENDIRFARWLRGSIR